MAEFPVTVAEKRRALEWAIRLASEEQSFGGTTLAALNELLKSLPDE